MNEILHLALEQISKISILSKIFNSLPIIILFISVLNEFDFNYLNFKY